MVEKDTIFTSKVKYEGIFKLSDFYKFCHEWLMDEGGLNITETKYSEKLIGDSKDIDIEWLATKEVTDYLYYNNSFYEFSFQMI